MTSPSNTVHRDAADPAGPSPVIRFSDPHRLNTLHVVTVFLVTAIVATSCLLLSAAESMQLVDGAVEWQANSPLRAVVQVLCLNYEFPTFHAGDVKNYLLGLGAGLIALVLTVSGLSRSHGEESGASGPDAFGASGVFDSRYRPLLAAQILSIAYVLWSFASSRWSHAPTLSVGASVVLALWFLWALGLAHGLNAAAARICVRAIVIVSAVVSLVAVWYFYGRNPVLAAKFPFGNPSFLAASLIPGVLLAAALLVEALRGADHGSPAAGDAESGLWRIGLGVLAVVAIGLSLWAFVLARSRGPAVGLVFGALAAWFFAARGRWKAAPAILGTLAVCAGAWYFSQQIDAASPTGRSATMRFRLHAWSYAWQMFEDRPIAGHGQGGYTLTADKYAADDVLDDPLAFVSRVEHAHSEWLEVLSDLGAVGLLLIGALLVTTIVAGVRAMHRADSGPYRVPLAALLGVLVGLVVEEFFGVGLRVTGVPTLFFTTLGLIWAMSGPPDFSLLGYASATPNRRIASGVVGGILGLAALTIAQQDFSAARDAYRAAESAREGQDDLAVEHAASSVFRLNPQRVLENTYRLVEANLRAAERAAGRAADRLQRAAQTDPPDPRLEFLAAQDLDTANAHARAATQALKRLVSASPGFINSGVLEARSNMLQARMAELTGDPDARDAFLNNAAAAMEREMQRQPFAPRLAADFVRLSGAALSVDDVFERLARPLHQHRLPEYYMAIVADLSQMPEFGERLDAVASQAKSVLRAGSPEARGAGGAWAPETLRLTSATRRLFQDYDASVDELLAACEAYDAFAAAAPMGAASCYAELATAGFLADPGSAAQSIEHAQKAMRLAPSSEAGRALRTSIEQGMIYYQLALGDEAKAREILRKLAPAHVSDEAIEQEMGGHLHRFCAMLVQRRREWLAGEDGRETLERMRKWLARARSLAPDDASVDATAAEVAILRRDADDFADRLSSALRKGLPLDAAKQLLDLADKEAVGNAAVEILRKSVTSALESQTSPTPSADPADDPAGAAEP